jgi:hypothetical protein
VVAAGVIPVAAQGEGSSPHDTKLRRVWSFGPDRTNDRGQLKYDPTNGMESRGDIVRVLAAGEEFAGVE